MSPRYYIGTTVIIGVLTLAISFWTKKQTGKEIFGVFVKVAAAFGAIIGGVLAIAWLLAYLGISQSGFLL
ncbi:MAG: hypothetical protein F3743_12560 [Nitrospinae bacterium]|nr:hypothetical protein [Nitrospinota bacterium]MZH06198.1 hypothetical protein [Nitrospinota bacterium]MZH15642.1 hypothetical protein [Nitrospinota bacterium]